MARFGDPNVETPRPLKPGHKHTKVDKVRKTPAVVKGSNKTQTRALARKGR